MMREEAMAWSTDDEYCSRSHNVATTPGEASDTATSGARDAGASDAGVILIMYYAECGGDKSYLESYLVNLAINRVKFSQLLRGI